MKKKDIDKMIKKYQPVVKRTGEQLSKALQAAEKDVAKMYKVAQIHVEIQMKNLQKEKLYYEIGKCVAEKIGKGGVNAEDLEKYKSRIMKMDSEGESVRKKLSRMSGKKNRTKKNRLKRFRREK